jgi:predicted nucleotidyltransferase
MPVHPADLAATLVGRRGADRARHRARAERLIARVRQLGRSLRAEGAIEGSWLVGSLAWGGFGARSDVDLVVRGAALEAMGAVASRAAEQLGPDAEGRIDVLRLEDLPPSFRDRVLTSGLRLDEP